jgi:hypothetical protein
MPCRAAAAPCAPADLDDLTTGARFHRWKSNLHGNQFAAIVRWAPVLAVVVFEVLLSSCAMFNHGNIRLPARADRVLRWFMVTPDMHRVHHSVEDDESHCNFGFNLTWWDRLLGTYRDQPRAGQQGMTLGIRDHRNPQEWRIWAACCACLCGPAAIPRQRPSNSIAVNAIPKSARGTFGLKFGFRAFAE